MTRIEDRSSVPSDCSQPETNVFVSLRSAGLNAKFAASAENDIFAPRSPRTPRLDWFLIGVDGCAARRAILLREEMGAYQRLVLTLARVRPEADPPGCSKRFFSIGGSAAGLTHP